VSHVGVHDGQAAVGRDVAARKVRQPAAAAHAQQIIGRGRRRVAAQRQQVAVGQRAADERRVAAVGRAAEETEGGRHAAGLQVDVAGAPRPHAQVERRHARL
jgi:hypothetical protein